MGTVVAGDFEWDEAKAAANLAKHGVSFEEAADALLLDPNEATFEDPADPSRVHSLAMSPLARILLVVTLERASRTRIVSARKANAHERRQYQAGT